MFGFMNFFEKSVPSAKEEMSITEAPSADLESFLQALRSENHSFMAEALELDEKVIEHIMTLFKLRNKHILHSSELKNYWVELLPSKKSLEVNYRTSDLKDYSLTLSLSEVFGAFSSTENQDNFFEKKSVRLLSAESTKKESAFTIALMDLSILRSLRHSLHNVKKKTQKAFRKSGSMSNPELRKAELQSYHSFNHSLYILESLIEKAEAAVKDSAIAIIKDNFEESKRKREEKVKAREMKAKHPLSESDLLSSWI